MQSTPTPREADPHDVFVIEPDVVLASRVDKAPLDLLYDVLSRPSDPRLPDPDTRIPPDFSTVDAAPPADAAPHAATGDDIRLGDTEIGAHQPTTSKFARRVVMGVLALGSAVGAAAWQHYGDDAKAVLAHWTPAFALASTPPAEKPVPAEQTSAPAVQTAAVIPSAVPPAAAAPPAEASAPASAAASAPEQAQLLQSMARDLAAMGQQINELKASIAEIKASQTQAAREPAKATEARLAEPKLAEPKPAEPRLAEPSPRPRIAPPATRAAAATAAVARKPKQVFPYAPIAPAPPPPAAMAAAPPPPAQAEDGGPVVRPPMPLH